MTRHLWAAIGALLGLAILFGLVALHEAHVAQQAALLAKRLDEAKLLAEKHVIVADQETQVALDAAASMETSLREEIDRLKALVPNAKPERVIVTTTPAKPVPPGQCVLPPGSEVSMRVAIVEMRTDKGNLVVVGDAMAIRTKPLPPLTIAEAVFEAKTTKVVEVERSERIVRERARWAVRGGALWSRAGQTPTGGYGGVGMRLVGPLWVEAGLQVDHGAAASVGIRWEF